MILREFQPDGSDQAALASFACSTGLRFENEVEGWIRTSAISWANDAPRASFQRRVLAFVDDEAGDTAAVVAWQDIARINLEGIWLEVLAVGLDYQHRGVGREALDVTMTHLRSIDRNGDHVAGLCTPTTPEASSCSRPPGGYRARYSTITSCGWVPSESRLSQPRWSTVISGRDRRPPCGATAARGGGAWPRSRRRCPTPPSPTTPQPPRPWGPRPPPGPGRRHRRAARTG